MQGKHTITISQEHINKAQRNSYNRCAVAIATRSEFPSTHGSTIGYTYINSECGEISLKNSATLKRWMHDFDSAKPVQPLTLIADFDKRRLHLDESNPMFQ